MACLSDRSKKEASQTGEAFKSEKLLCNNANREKRQLNKIKDLFALFERHLHVGFTVQLYREMSAVDHLCSWFHWDMSDLQGWTAAGE